MAGHHTHGAAARAFDPADPHHEEPHAHHVNSALTLWGVLIALLALTALTVGASFAEKWVASAFDITIPHIINVLIALSIALVKGALVVLYFMGLKHDNPINAVVLIFTLFAVALFLAFTMIDLGTRGTVYDYKSRNIVAGGTGIAAGSMTGGKPIVEYWREAYISEFGMEKYLAEMERAHAKAGKFLARRRVFENK
ncbi:cytochrome C oxidase subunit IV family protein [Leptolyngbya sp. 15MV]|nr:cytochrome C oxidase subunit IV family protein [Leptolyngbya sp. 15MV]